MPINTIVLEVFIGLISAALLITSGTSLNSNQNYLYVIFIILATITYAASVIILKWYLQSMNALTIAVGNFIVIIIPAFILLASSGFFKTENLNSPELKSALFYLVVLWLFCTAIANVLFNKRVHVATPVFASSVAYLMPIAAIFCGILDGEKLSLLQMLASGII